MQTGGFNRNPIVKEGRGGGERNFVMHNKPNKVSC